MQKRQDPSVFESLRGCLSWWIFVNEGLTTLCPCGVFRGRRCRLHCVAHELSAYTMALIGKDRWNKKLATDKSAASIILQLFFLCDVKSILGCKKSGRFDATSCTLETDWEDFWFRSDPNLSDKWGLREEMERVDAYCAAWAHHNVSLNYRSANKPDCKLDWSSTLQFAIWVIKIISKFVMFVTASTIYFEKQNVFQQSTFSVQKVTC